MSVTICPEDQNGTDRNPHRTELLSRPNPHRTELWTELCNAQFQFVDQFVGTHFNSWTELFVGRESIGGPNCWKPNSVQPFGPPSVTISWTVWGPPVYMCPRDLGAGSVWEANSVQSDQYFGPQFGPHGQIIRSTPTNISVHNSVRMCKQFGPT